jgi:hypothetical protein
MNNLGRPYSSSWYKLASSTCSGACSVHVFLMPFTTFPISKFSINGEVSTNSLYSTIKSLQDRSCSHEQVYNRSDSPPSSSLLHLPSSSSSFLSLHPSTASCPPSSLHPYTSLRRNYCSRKEISRTACAPAPIEATPSHR